MVRLFGGKLDFTYVNKKISYIAGGGNNETKHRKKEVV